MPSERQYTNACFTFNNPEVLFDFSEEENVEYAIYSLEIGESGTPHYQGYIEFKKKTTLGRIHNMFGGEFHGVHVEARRGKQAEAIAYCYKPTSPYPDHNDGSFIEGPWVYGAPKMQGERSDILELHQLVATGPTMKTVIDTLPHQFYKYSTSIVRALPYYQRKRDRTIAPTVHLLYGATGLGKSRWAWDTFPDLFPKQASKWWDGYNGETVVLFEDYAGCIAFDEFLRILDRYPLSIQTKGGSCQLLATTFVITSNDLPGDWYAPRLGPGGEVLRRFNIDALYRRITHWHYFHAGELPRHGLTKQEFDNHVFHTNIQ